MAKNITNDKSNTILSGTNGNDSITNYGSQVSIAGGKGNDSIRNYYGANVALNGGDGEDKIFDYQSGDMLQILKSNGTTGKFTKSKYSGRTLSLTISGGGQITFDNVTTSTNFNINGTSYKINDSKLKKQ